LPSPADLDRGQRRLDGIGWPVDPEFSYHAVMLAVRRVCCRRHSKRAPIRSHRAGVRRSWLWQRLLRGTVTAGATPKTGLNDEERKALRAQGFVGEPPLGKKRPHPRHSNIFTRGNEIHRLANARLAVLAASENERSMVPGATVQRARSNARKPLLKCFENTVGLPHPPL